MCSLRLFCTPCRALNSKRKLRQQNFKCAYGTSNLKSLQHIFFTWTFLHIWYSDSWDPNEHIYTPKPLPLCSSLTDTRYDWTLSLVYYSNITSATRTLCYKIIPGVHVSILHIPCKSITAVKISKSRMFDDNFYTTYILLFSSLATR